MKPIRLGIAALLILCGCAQNVPTNPQPDQATNTFQQLMEESLSSTFGSIHGVSMAIVSPELSEPWSGATGFDSRENKDSVSVAQPFRIASITKTFVATAILRLHEMDSLSIDDPIRTYISQEHIQIIQKGGYDPDKILLRHCLNHTSGLFDYAVGSNTFKEKAKENPSRRWTRTDQLEGAMAWGEKVGEPGEKYSYGDTGYILLGETIESFFGGDLALGLRTLLKFEGLGMRHTWLETLEVPPPNMLTPVHRYLGQLNATKYDPSIDLYGGGGLMSICPDLVTFFQALFNHRVFDKTSTLDLMLTKPQYAASYDPTANERHKDYRYGLWEFTIYGEKAYMHGGVWGTILIHVPAYNSSFAANFTKGWNDRILKKAILVVKNLKEN